MDKAWAAELTSPGIPLAQLFLCGIMGFPYCFSQLEVSCYQLVGSPGAQTVKNLPAMWETWVRSLPWEDNLEKKSNPLQYPCLENAMDRGAWRATVHRVAKTTTEVTENVTLREEESLSRGFPMLHSVSEICLLKLAS